MSSNVQQYVPFKRVSGIIIPKVSTDALKLLNPNATALSLGSATEEGGNLVIYRDTSGNEQVIIDADAASNAIAVDIYGGVVCQNFLTVGQTTLNTTYPLSITGNCLISGAAWISGVKITNDLSVYDGSGLNSRADNYAALVSGNISVGGTDATNHAIKMQIDSNDIITAQATGDGSGGIVGKRAIITGGQCASKVDAGAADYNPSILTSDYIITVNTTAAARAVTISAEDKATGSATSPRIFIIKDIAGNAGTNNITVSLETAGTIDGDANYVINSDYNSITLMIDGTNGYII